MITTVEGIEHRLSMTPAHVQCDECGDMYRCLRYSKWGTPEQRERLRADLLEAGWYVEGNHERHVCPLCVSSTGLSAGAGDA
jgi:hypothetical protein